MYEGGPIHARDVRMTCPSARSATLAGLVLASALSLAPRPAEAQACQGLWYQRNEIYARNGYCFRTARARSVFGPGCFPPYGQLSYGEQRRVNQLQAQEDMMGCPR